MRQVYSKALWLTGVYESSDRFCFWISDGCEKEALGIPDVRERVDAVKSYRLSSRDDGLAPMSARPHQFREMKTARERTIIIPGLSSERREYTPVGLLGSEIVVSLTAFAIYDGPLYCLALISSKLSFIWNFTASVSDSESDRLYHAYPVDTQAYRW